MKTCFGWFFLLLSHARAYRFLDETCGAWPTNKAPSSGWLATISNATHLQCHGTLINRRFVLTSALCIYLPGTKIVEFGSAKYSVSRLVVHKKYLQHDIGLVKLSSSVEFNPFIYPICIILDQEKNKYVRNTPRFKAVAWSPNYNALQVIELKEVYSSYPTQIFATSFSKRTNCYLELGGPLAQYIFFGNSQRAVQFGIRSYGGKGCNENGAYTNLENYAGWIEETVKKFSTEDQRPEQPPDQGIWLYEDCGGNTLSSKLRAFIYAPHFSAQGWFITDRFVITNANALPDDASSLDVGLAGTPRSYDEFRVLSIFQHPGYSQYYQNDIALLKLNRPVTIGKLSPVCMLAQKEHQEEVESSSPLTAFDFVQTENHITIFEKNVSLIESRKCSHLTSAPIDQNQLCVGAPRGTSPHYGNSGDVLIKKVMYKAKEWFVLLGIASYSSNGVQVFTNVVRHTDWITQVIASN
ncbi:uncharacterized protein LOC108022132 [Drosophila biarmipes]|uniref:uncharacterized protein LOC108022132 n=1 Tax=Drosophila biarmipes TaxID=125945 RepID=UPI0007E5DC12|nr:uncharacterized protein LOC108022132 [Drosophila biarmipes]